MHIYFSIPKSKYCDFQGVRAKGVEMSKHSFHNETGSALVIALLALMMITMMAVAMIGQTMTETNIVGQHVRATQAFWRGSPPRSIGA